MNKVCKDVPREPGLLPVTGERINALGDTLNEYGLTLVQETFGFHTNEHLSV